MKNKKHIFDSLVKYIKTIFTANDRHEIVYVSLEDKHTLCVRVESPISTALYLEVRFWSGSGNWVILDTLNARNFARFEVINLISKCFDFVRKSYRSVKTNVNPVKTIGSSKQVVYKRGE